MTDLSVSAHSGVFASPRAGGDKLVWLSRLLNRWLTLPLVLWALLWLQIDTGPWNLTSGADSGGAFGFINAVRASFPLLVLGIALLALCQRRIQHQPTLAETGFWLYAAFMLISSFQVLNPWFHYAYWALAFLATTAVTHVGFTRGGGLAFAQRLNLASWLIASATLVVLLVFARHALFEGSGFSSYGIHNRVKDIAGMPMSRSSGLSRLAAVPAIIALVYVFRGRWWQRGLAVIAFLGAFLVIWTMQSRGSLVAFLSAFLFVLLFGDRRARNIGMLTGSVLVVLLLSDTVSSGLLHDLWQHATRGTGAEGFQSMSGRTLIWHDAWHYIQQAPWLGYGPRGDRRIIHSDAQGAIVYAMLNAGLLGTICFVVGMGAAWVSLVRLLRRRRHLSYAQHTMVTITGGILVFSTLRSIPEDTAAFFSIDLLLQYPAMVYLAILHRRLRKEKRQQRFSSVKQYTAIANQIHANGSGVMP